MARRIAGQPLDIKATEWNAIDAAINRKDVLAQTNNSKFEYVEAVGKNLAGETLTPGSPIFYKGVTTEVAPDVYTVRTSGYYELRHCYWPINTTQIADFVTDGHAFTRVGVVLDTIPDGGAGRFAIGGIVGVKRATGGLFARPTFKAGSYKTQLTGDRWGYRILGTYGDWSIIDLDSYYAGMLLAQTKTGGLATGSVGLVQIMDETPTGYAVTTDEYPAWTVVSSIAANTIVGLWPNQSRWLALKVC